MNRGFSRGCRRARLRIFREVDKSLSLDERFLLDEHLIVCRDCEDRYEQMRGREETVPPRGRQRLSLAEGPLTLDRKLVESHGDYSKHTAQPGKSPRALRSAPRRERHAYIITMPSSG